MKKMLCLLMALIMCASLFAACGGEKENESDRDSDSEKNKEISVDITEFTGVALTRLKGVNITVHVDEEYRDALGETVEVVLPELIDSDVGVGDTVQVKIDRVVNTSPLTVYAADFDCWGESGSKEDIVKIDISGFTGVAATKLSGVNITVDVCDEYKDVLGDTVKVVLPELYDLYVGVGYTVEVTVDYVIDTEPLTVYALAFDAYTYDEPDDDYPVAEKPVIYLYPETDTECSVKVTLTNGKLTCTYPEHGANGWQNFVARPDGTLIFPDGKQYYCLYWEGKCDLEPDFTKGACVKGSETAAFLEKALAEMGLSEREANEFIIYWLPILQANPYNLISFQTEAYTSVAELEITPTPDSLLRVYMTAKPMDHYEEIEPQTFDGFERKGFTVVEWGGSIIE